MLTATSAQSNQSLCWVICGWSRLHGCGQQKLTRLQRCAGWSKFAGCTSCHIFSHCCSFIIWRFHHQQNIGWKSNANRIILYMYLCIISRNTEGPVRQQLNYSKCPEIAYTKVSGQMKGLLGEAKVSCILRHRGIQLRLAYTVGQGLLSLQQVRIEGEYFYFFCFFTFIHFPLSPIPFFHLLYYLSSPFLWETTQNDPQGLTCR